ncbi:MAG: DedA family protein [Ignavibacteriaceae bacterium]|jgi:membrane protein DedA with SNARE-associated domain
MIEHLLESISSLSPFWIYIVLFFFSFFENVFPPSPADFVTLIGGSLIVSKSIDYLPTLLVTTFGSAAGFMVIFFIGSQLDKKVVRTGKIKFISVDALFKVENLFLKYGYFIILSNRFLPGMRSVISLFAGLSELNVKKTALFAAISALIWNAGIIYLGVLFGQNLKYADNLISTYSDIVLIVLVIVLAIYLLRYFILRKKKNKK